MLSAFSAAGAAGCATIVTGTTDVVRILSTPAGATVAIQGQVVETPASLTLSRSISNPPLGTATLEGYREARFEVPREFNLWTIGNVVTLGLGVPVDVLSGAFFRYPEQHHVLLNRED